MDEGGSAVPIPAGSQPKYEYGLKMWAICSANRRPIGTILRSVEIDVVRTNTLHCDREKLTRGKYILSAESQLLARVKRVVSF